MGTVYGNLGDVYQTLGMNDSSRYYLRECIRISDRPGYNIVAADISKIILDFIDMHSNKPLSLTGIFNRNEDSLKAIKCDEMDKVTLMEVWYQLKYTYHENNGNMDSAFIYQDKLFSHVDSIRGMQRDLRLADMESVFANKELQYRLSLLERDNKLRRSSLLFTIASGSMVCVILLIVWRNLKRSRKISPS